jgi:membrane protease YdiL (CAAX protease family)
MKRIGLTIPFVLLLVFAIAFHPAMRVHLMRFTNPWVYMLFSPQMFFLLASILIISKNKIPFHQIGLTFQPLQRNLILGIGAGLVPYVNKLMGGADSSNEEVQHYELSQAMIFSLFIFAPIAEELFFRGIVFHALEESYAFFISMIASSILFAACHSSMMIGPFVMGIIAAIMTKKTKSIFPGMIFHSLSNGLPWFYMNHCHNLQPFEKWLFFKF